MAQMINILLYFDSPRLQQLFSCVSSPAKCMTQFQLHQKAKSYESEHLYLSFRLMGILNKKFLLYFSYEITDH
jgi:hypothetical protein